MLLFQSVGDGRKGYALDGPYNAIHVGAAAPILPKEVQTKRFIDKYRSNNVKIPFDLVKCTHAINCNQFCFLINCMGRISAIFLLFRSINDVFLSYAQRINYYELSVG